MLNAANEVAVETFLSGDLGFLKIAELVERTMNRVPGCDPASLDEVIEIDGEARRAANDILRALG